MAEHKNPWKTLSGEKKYENQWIDVTEYQVINPSGGQGIYGKVSFKSKAIAVLPIDEEGYTWLVGQYRYTLEEYSWEIPMGAVPFDESTETGALRELNEETGLHAEKLEHLGRIHTSNSVTDEVGHVFIATGLSMGETNFDDTEDITVKRVPFAEALEMVMNGDITDSISQMAILKYARILDQNG